MLSEMGSNFWYNPENIKGNTNITPEIYGIKGSDFLWLYSGRSSICFALKTILERNPELNKKALLPPYTCHTVFNPFYEYGFEVESYEIDKNFITSKEVLLKRVDEVKPSVVLLQRYFGFETLTSPKELVEELHNRGIIVIEDCTQTLFSNLETLDVDFYVASVRKYFGTPDGGFVVCKEGSLNKSDILDINVERSNKYNEASKLKENYMNTFSGDKSIYYSMFGEAEEMLDVDKVFRKISQTSLMIQSQNDPEFIRKTRIRNYKLLYSELKACRGMRIILPEPSEDEAPLYFPIYVENDRKALQAHLRNSSIYAPIVWPRPDTLPSYLGEVADDFYNHVICLIIDQRYDEDDIRREAYRVNQYFKTPNMVPDIFYMDKYVELFLEQDGEAYDFYRFEHQDGTVIYPYVLRKSPELDDGKNYYDIITPRGFNGPLVIDKKSDDLSKLVDDFNEDFERYCKEKGIITEYIRFCPWEYNAELFSKYYPLRDNNATVAIDLTVNDILMDEINSKRRNQIRSAIKKGVKVEYDFEGKTVGTFYKLYQNTKEKNNIGSYYDFSLEFLKKHFEYLKGNCWLANAVVNDEIISSTFVLMCGDNIHYHLSANDYTKNEYNGNSLLLYEIAKLGKAYGCTKFHLGGVGVAAKSLMDFKTSFTKNGVYPFYVSAKVRNQKVYDGLVKKYKKEGSNYFPAYRG